MNSSTTIAHSLPAERAGQIAKTAGYYAAFVVLGLVSASMGPTLPYLAQNTNSMLSAISYLITARSLGYLIGSSQGGRIYDRIGGHPVQAVALLFMSAMMMLFPLATQLWVLTIICLLTGIGEGVLDVGGNTLLVWVHRDKVGPFMNGLHLFFGLGAFLSPLIVARMLLWTHTVTWAYWTLAVLALPVAVLLLRLPSPPTQASAQDRGPARINVPLVVMISLFFFLAVGSELGFSNWIFTYAVRMKLGNETTAAYLTSAFWGAFTAGRLIAIPLAVRLRPQTILLSNLLLCLASVGVIMLWPASALAAWVGVMGAGLAIAPLFATTMSLAEQLMPITGRVTGLFFIGISSSGLIMPWLIGQLFEPIGPQVMTWAIFIDILLALLIFCGGLGRPGLMRRSSNPTLSKVQEEEKV